MPEEKKMMIRFSSILMVLTLTAAVVGAGEADVEAVRVWPTGENRYRFEVTVRHADTGWDHYADRFEILDVDGHILGTRILYHPHVEEQPFTRRLENVEVRPEILKVTVRAHDSRHGYGGRQMIVKQQNR